MHLRGSICQPPVQFIWILDVDLVFFWFSLLSFSSNLLSHSLQPLLFSSLSSCFHHYHHRFSQTSFSLPSLLHSTTIEISSSLGVCPASVPIYQAVLLSFLNSLPSSVLLMQVSIWTLCSPLSSSEDTSPLWLNHLCVDDTNLYLQPSLLS